MIRRLAVIAAVMAVVWASVGFTPPASAAPTGVPPIPFSVGNDLQPSDGSPWDTTHYVQAATWIVAVAALPNNGGINPLDGVDLARRIVTDQGAQNLTPADSRRFRAGYAVATHALVLAKPAPWWTFGLFHSCTGEPTPQMPGRGFSGWLDSGPNTVDPTLAVTPTTVYQTVQYPPQWHLYDVGCAAAAQDTGASLDTWIGNQEMGFATSLVAVANSLRRVVAQPTFLDKLNPLVAHGTDAMMRALFNPYIDLSILIIGLGVIWSARRQNMHHALTTAGWALLVVTAVAAVVAYPVAAAHWSDQTNSATVGAINDNMLGATKPGADPSSSSAELLTDNVLYKNWLRGELGSTTSAVAVKYGPLLLAAQKYTYAEARILNTDPVAGAKITKRKREQFNRVAQAVAFEDPAAYQTLKGTGDSRTGAGAIAIASALLTVPFIIASSLVILASLLLQRILVILAPAVGIVAVHWRLRKFAHTALTVAVAAFVNAVVFAAGAALNILAVGALLGDGLALPEWLAILICGMFTYILWHAMKPFRRLTAMVSPGEITAGAAGATFAGPRKALRKIAGIGLGVGLGEKLAGRRGHGGDDPDTADTVPDTVPEEWTRPTSTPESTPPRPTPTVNPARPLRDVRVMDDQPEPVGAVGSSAPTSDSYGGAGAGELTGQPALESGDIIPADQPLHDMDEYRPDGSGDGVIYRIWDSSTQRFITVTADGSSHA